MRRNPVALDSEEDSEHHPPELLLLPMLGVEEDGVDGAPPIINGSASSSAHNINCENDNENDDKHKIGNFVITERRTMCVR